jgi:hypothetical protein
MFWRFVWRFIYLIAPEGATKNFYKFEVFSVKYFKMIFASCLLRQFMKHTESRFIIKTNIVLVDCDVSPPELALALLRECSILCG